jgi:hypothetical protein
MGCLGSLKLSVYLETITEILGASEKKITFGVGDETRKEDAVSFIC